MDASAEMAELNDHDDAVALTITNENTTVGGRYVAFVFPEMRNLDGYFIEAIQTGGSFVIEAVETSSDTVDGAGGTWSPVAANWTEAGALSPTWRSGIVTLSATGIKAIRFRYNWNTGSSGRQIDWKAIHLYGSVVTGENPNRLRAWHPTLDEEVSAAYFDFADIAQGTQQTKQFRLKNNNSTQTAQGVTLSQDNVDGGGMALQFSADGTTFTSPLTVGDIAPNVTTGVLHVRRSVGAAETVQLRASLIKAVASSWS